MALDEALLESAADRGLPTLRFYGWEEPTLSLGYFQSHEQRTEHIASRDRPLIRRASGGGAIVHDQELTYSLAIPAKHRLARRIEALYDAIHQALVQTLDELGVTATLYCPKQSDPTRENEEEPFLCFQRRARGDVILGQTKIGGSAQRRRGGAALLHGSLLLAKSDAAPELDGLCELTGDDRWRLGGERAKSLESRWAEIVLERLGFQGTLGSFDQEERYRAESLTREKYGASNWILKR